MWKLFSQIGYDHPCLCCVLCSYVFVGGVVLCCEYSLVLFGFVFVSDVISLHIFGGFVLGFALGLLMSLLFGALICLMRTLRSFSVGLKCPLVCIFKLLFF